MTGSQTFPTGGIYGKLILLAASGNLTGMTGGSGFLGGWGGGRGREKQDLRPRSEERGRRREGRRQSSAVTRLDRSLLYDNLPVDIELHV